jgi:branched-chain amino acid transport system substrate-binding protein
MRWVALLALTCVAAIAANAAEPVGEGAPTAVVEPSARKLLGEYQGRDLYYQPPRVPLKTEEKYAHTIKELEAFSGNGSVQPYKKHFLEQLEYWGPGRGIPEPDDVTTVKIGFIGPLFPTVSVATGGKSHNEELMGRKMLQGCQLAIEEANAKGGHLKRKLPFELIIKNDNGLWGSTGDEVIKLNYKDKVWAIVGSIDGANSHIAIRVALKCEIVMLNSGDTDPTFIETNIPWVARVIGDDRQMNYLLVNYMYRKMGFKRVGIIRSSNRYGRFGVRQINDGSRRLEHPAAIEMAYKLGQDDFSLEVGRLKAADVDAVVHWGNAVEGAKILNLMRSMGMKQPYLCNDRCVDERFVQIAGDNAEGVVCMYPWNPASKDPKLGQFRANFRKKFGEEAETYAAHAYDGMNILIWAIQTAGLNRAKIRDMIAYRTEPWPGVSGDIVFSSVLDDIGEVFAAKREKGQWRYCSREDLGLPSLGASQAAAQPPKGATPTAASRAASP